MGSERKIWLVNNAASGSNDQDALEALERCCGDAGFHVAHRTVFPEQDLPSPDILRAAGIDRVAVFAGDGTVNTLVGALAGWDGAVLVLPGGTMNLLYHRLHGERTMEEVIALAAGGEARSHRPGVIRSRQGSAFAGLLAGPGTSWNQVREAMRATDLAQLAGGTIEAIEETLTGEMIACADPRLGRTEGYPLVMLTPHDEGIEIEAYHAESAGDYLEQAWALLKRNFRDGPHDVLGTAERVVLASTEGQAFGLLVDGEPQEAPPRAEFVLAPCEVDLLTTHDDGR